MANDSEKSDFLQQPNFSSKEIDAELIYKGKFKDIRESPLLTTKEKIRKIDEIIANLKGEEPSLSLDCQLCKETGEYLFRSISGKRYWGLKFKWVLTVLIIFTQGITWSTFEQILKYLGGN